MTERYPYDTAVVGDRRDGLLPSEVGTSSVRRWHEIVRSSLVSLDFEAHDADRFSAGLWSERIGPLGIVGIRGTELTAHRSRSQTRDPAGETTILIIQLTGSGIIEQSGREGLVDSGSIVFLDLAEPYTVRCQTSFTQLVLQVPTEDLHRHGVLPARRMPFTGVPVPVTGAVSPPVSFLCDLAQRSRSGDDLTSLSDAAMGMMAMLAAEAQRLGPGAGSHGSHVADLRHRALELARKRCADPAVGAETLARALHVSRRTLYRLFEADQRTLTDHIADMRLEIAAGLLRAADSSLSVNDVASMSGFRATSTFHAKFLQRYGVTPGEFRATHRHPPTGTLPE